MLTHLCPEMNMDVSVESQKNIDFGAKQNQYEFIIDMPLFWRYWLWIFGKMTNSCAVSLRIFRQKSLFAAFTKPHIVVEDR